MRERIHLSTCGIEPDCASANCKCWCHESFVSESDIVYKKLLKYKSFRESTPRTREDKLRRALQRRKKLREMS